MAFSTVTMYSYICIHTLNNGEYSHLPRGPDTTHQSYLAANWTGFDFQYMQAHVPRKAITHTHTHINKHVAYGRNIENTRMHYIYHICVNIK